MPWSEKKRKELWGKKHNPAVMFGFFLIIIGFFSGGLAFLVLGTAGLAIIWNGYLLYKKYS